MTCQVRQDHDCRYIGAVLAAVRIPPPSARVSKRSCSGSPPAPSSSGWAAPRWPSSEISAPPTTRQETGARQRASALFQKFTVVNSRGVAECRHFAPDPKWLRPKLFRAATVRDWFFDRSLGIVREFPKESTRSRTGWRSTEGVSGKLGLSLLYGCKFLAPRCNEALSLGYGT